MADLEARKKRSSRVRGRLKKLRGDRPRLSVFRSGKHIGAQLIDDRDGKTLVSASSKDKDIREGVGKGSTAEAAAAVGKILGERASKAGVKTVVFDRGGYLFHGRVKALADAARDAGLEF
ncbi:MAG: 50S ribosomal protein L18 [Pseudomonadota bacterium]